MNTQDKVCKILRECLYISDVSPINLNSDLRKDLSMDSLDAVQLSMDLEDEFSVEISNDEIEKVKTIQDVISLIESKL